MRRHIIAVTIAALALAACNKKDDAAKAKPATAKVEPTPVAPTPGSGPGTAAPTPTPTPTADPAAVALANKAGNCPSAVLGATTTIVDDPAAAGKLVLTITAKNDAAAATIRKRIAHLVEVQAAADAEIKHTGDGTGGGGVGMCPVITTKDTKIAAADTEGGSRITIEPQAGASLDALRKEVEARITKTSDWTQANVSGTSSSGGGGGTGGGQGDHGGNHSGKGKGTGKKEPPPTKM